MRGFLRPLTNWTTQVAVMVPDKLVHCRRSHTFPDHWLFTQWTCYSNPGILTQKLFKNSEDLRVQTDAFLFAIRYPVIPPHQDSLHFFGSWLSATLMYSIRLRCRRCDRKFCSLADVRICPATSLRRYGHSNSPVPFIVDNGQSFSGGVSTARGSPSSSREPSPVFCGQLSTWWPHFLPLPSPW